MVEFITDVASCDNEARATESTPMRRLATARRNAPGMFRGSASQVLHQGVIAAGTLRRHTLRLLLRQQGRCGVTFADCCCGSRDVAASHLQTAVAAAGQRLGSTVVPAQYIVSGAFVATVIAAPAIEVTAATRAVTAAPALGVVAPSR